MINVAIIDESPSVRRGIRLRLALEPDITVVAETGDTRTPADLLRETTADVIIVDIADQAALAEAGVQAAPAVVISHDDGERARRAAMAAGAFAFVPKASLDRALVESIRRAARTAHQANEPKEREKS
jgi:DNA-binding NarL/FixJ family response regulator